MSTPGTRSVLAARPDDAPARGAAPAPALEARAVRKTYLAGRANAYEALRGVDLQVPRGELAAIVGPSGSGKSTLMNLLSTLDRPTSGAILVDGFDTSAMDDSTLARLRNRHIGIVFQAYNLIPRLTALENVMLPLVPQSVPLPEREARATEALEAVGLGSRLRNRPSEMSGGEQQRTSVARALVTRPTILLGDEPTGNLDTRTSEAVMDLLCEINRARGVTTVLITHDPEIAARTHRVIQIRDGRIENDERQKA